MTTKGTPDAASTEARLAELELLVSAMKTQYEAQIAEKNEQIEKFQRVLEGVREELGDDDDEDSHHVGANLIYDPYHSQDPFRILKNLEPTADFPEGQVLSWKNAKWRERQRGWRGWKPMQYGDPEVGPNGENLKGYIPDPPTRMIGPDAIDSYVRRADVVLCRMDARIWRTRQLLSMAESAKRVASAGSSKQVILDSDGQVSLVGPGLKDSKRPRGGFKPNKPEFLPTAPLVKGHRPELAKQSHRVELMPEDE